VASVATTSGGKLIATDSQNSRVLIWKAIPSTDGVAADLVLGQTSTTSNGANDTGSYAEGLNTPTGNPSADDSLANSYLAVPDTGNDRVVIWTPFPTMGPPATMTPTAANEVLGQVNLTSKPVAFKDPPSAQNLNNPMGVSQGGNLLFVTDEENSRVLGWNWPLNPNPPSPPAAATLVFGQPTLASNGANSVGLSAASLSHPHSAYSDGTHLVVTDTDNNRVMIWNVAAPPPSQNAELVLGQPDFLSNLPNNVAMISQNTLNSPFGITGTGSQLIVSDQENSRLLLWNPLPQSGGTAPSVVLGQADFTHGQPNSIGNIGAGLCAPSSVATDGTRLFVADTCNNRVLIWNSIPADLAQEADLVIGQPNLNSNTPNAGATGIVGYGLQGPMGVASDGQRLLVADTGNNRVLLWNSIPTQSLQPADLVLGQSNLTTVATTQTLASNSLSGPEGLLFDGTHLIVADSGDDRVLIWESVPSVNQAPADVVLGQSEFVNDQRLRPGNLWNMVGPTGVYLDRSRLFVADTLNNRVLYWNTLPTLNGQNADGFIGQPTSVDVAANNAGDPSMPQLTAQTLYSPTSVFATVDILYIADQGNNRIVAVPNPPLP
jgi:hypothetical protein